MKRRTFLEALAALVGLRVKAEANPPFGEPFLFKRQP
jgi:hypothetical protein